MTIVRIKKRILYSFIFLKDRIYGGNKSFNADEVKHLVLMVGPYRNLTTYLTSILSIHPNCKILNHAGIRVFPNRGIHFLNGYSLNKYKRFLRFFDYASKKGYKGMLGGNISYSHAFESNPELSKLYAEWSTKKTTNHCMIWKESHMLTNLLMNRSQDLNKILEENPAVKFLFPVRNPLDCAVSNAKTGKSRFFTGIDSQNILDITRAIFEQHLFFLSIQERYPNRVFFIFENEIQASTISELCSFLDIDKDEHWIDTVLKQHKIKSGYNHSKETVDYTLELIESLFVNHDGFRQKLRTLI